MVDSSTFFEVCKTVFGSLFFREHEDKFNFIYKECCLEFYGFDPVVDNLEEIYKSEISDDLPF